VRTRTFAAAACAAAVALAVAYAGLRWGVLVAGGSDSYGYVSQAALWRRGTLVVRQPIVRPTPWPYAADTWTPLGYRPSPHIREGYVPLYAPGLPLLMAAAQAVAGFCAAFTIVPICGAVTVWLTFVLGRHLFGAPRIALGGAALVATSPVFVYQVLNAMSDVPTTAFWTLALVLAVVQRPLASGLAMTTAIAIRPNLAPLAAIIAAWIWIAGADRSERGRSLLRFAAGTAPAVIGIAWLNARLYESPFTSGYGTTSDLYSLRYVTTNAANFVSWLMKAETVIVALAAVYVAMPALAPSPRLRGTRLLAGGTIAAILLSYLFYRPFDVWWYLRFLLPMWPMMMLATAAGIAAIASRLAGSADEPRRAAIAIAAVVALVSLHHLRFLSSHSVFDLGRSERKYVDVARFVADHTEPDAVILSRLHSGSLRFYADRQTLRFDILDPGWLDRSLTWLQSGGHHPYLVLDGREVEEFRLRFAGSRAGPLAWPPIAELNGVVFVYDALGGDPSSSPLAIAATRGSRTLLPCDPPSASSRSGRR
jgi:hypothetical protein